MIDRPVESAAETGGKPEGRDAVTGRFTANNQAARGNVIARRMASLRLEVLRRIGRKEVGAVVDKLLSLALEGNTTAASMILERGLGRTRTSPEGAETGAGAMTAPRTASDIVEAHAQNVEALGRGDIDVETALKRGELLELSRRSIETFDLAQRVAAIEQSQNKQWRN